MLTVEVRQAAKRIQGRDILRNINLRLKPGCIYGFVGANGSGKTMLFRLLSGLIRPSEGEVLINGQKLGQAMDFPPSLGIVIEKNGFWEHYTGLRNLEILASIKKQVAPAELRIALEAVGLKPDDPRRYKQYSLGMKQRLAIAQAIMEKPLLLILDEPFSALDDEGKLRIRQLILDEKRRGATVLLSSHYREDIDLLCDAVYKMTEGSLEVHEKV